MILILGWVFVPFYSRSMVYTMPEFLERRYNPQSRTILSVISLVSYVLTKVAVTVYAGGLVFQQVFGIKELWGIDFFWIAAIGLVVLTALYTIFGGMKSVLYTSVLQTPILLLGSLIILVLGFKELGGWDEMMRVCGAVTVNDYGDTMTNLIRSNMMRTSLGWVHLSVLPLSVSGTGVLTSSSYNVYFPERMKKRLVAVLSSALT